VQDRKKFDRPGMVGYEPWGLEYFLTWDLAPLLLTVVCGIPMDHMAQD